ncbi:MAG: LOG family protein [Pseudanabaena sp. RU_4_16]|nr:LOG family protein [Pseudanabaena sp. RU_4_16]
MSASKKSKSKDRRSSPTDPKISGEVATFEVIQDAVLQLWGVVNRLTDIRPPKRKRYRVTIFGSARLQPDNPLYAGVRHLASQLTVMGCDIVTGGGPGLMQAANEGSVIADPGDLTESIGIRVELDAEQSTNPFVEQVYKHQTFFSRLHHFVLLSDAFVVVPGGIGTTLEAMMIWQLLQVRKLHNTPFIMVGKMWFDLNAWAQEHMVNVEHKMANPIDMHIPRCVDNFEEAIALLRASHAEWQHRSK